MHEFISPFLDSLSANGASQNTVRAYSADIHHFVEWAGPDGTPDDAPKYLTAHRDKWAAKTTQRKVSALRAFARFQGAIILTNYRSPTAARPQPHPMPEGINGVLELVDAATKVDHKMLISLCGLMGLRINEARSVMARDFDWHERTLKVRGKGDRERVVPLSRMAEHHLLPVVSVLTSVAGNDQPLIRLSDRGARKAITELAKKCGFQRRVASHDLRATFATAAYANSLNLRAVQELLGHADSKTTEIYTGITMSEMRKAAEIA